MIKKEIVLYMCQFCGKEFYDKDECINHEKDEHIGLTDEEYNIWRSLVKKNIVLRQLANQYPQYIKDADDTNLQLTCFEEFNKLDGIQIIDFESHTYSINPVRFKEHQYRKRGRRRSDK